MAIDIPYRAWLKTSLTMTFVRRVAFKHIGKTHDKQQTCSF
jgi:hypothetical protein